MNRRRGFTLIELSIVLVIIGLLAGGVLVGQSLIAASAVRAQAAQIIRYSSAVNTFQSKYSALPGDMLIPSARQFGLPANPTGVGWPSNGNGVFDSAATPGQFLYTATDEEIVFWAQLSYANMVEGQFSCVNDTTCNGLPGNSYTGIALAYPATIGTYFPAMKLNPLFGIMPLTVYNIGNMWALGAEGFNYTAPNAGVLVPSLTPAQAQALDQKMDDGTPSGGNVRVLKFPGQNNAQGVCCTGFDTVNDDNIASGNYSTPLNCVSNLGASYNLSNGNIACMVFIKMQ